jgi:hypothetical protein
MAKFSIRQLLALTALCAVWFATFNPGQFGVFVHIALGYLFIVAFLVANRFNVGVLGPVSCAISRAITTLSSLCLLFLLPIAFQADTSRSEHWEFFFEILGYLTILISTIAAAEWVWRQSQKLEAPNRLWLLYIGISTILFGIAIVLLAFSRSPRQQPENNLALGIVLFNAAYFVAYAVLASWRARKFQSAN